MDVDKVLAGLDALQRGERRASRKITSKMIAAKLAQMMLKIERAINMRGAK